MVATPPAPPMPVVRQAIVAAGGERVRFERLFTPGAEGVPASEIPPDALEILVGLGVLLLDGAQARARLWVKLRGDRPYIMSLVPPGTAQQYLQDVWPETDAMLERLARAPAGTLLDVGTGSGVIAIEAALRGHRVTATDLFPAALELARINAAMHEVELELLLGHLLDPVRGRRFDLVITAPHYSAPVEQLRAEVLRAGVEHVAPGGSFFLATFLEWGQGEPPGLVASLLAPMAASGRVEVRPISSPIKNRWFTTPVPHAPHVPARHRFTIEVWPDGPPGLDFASPGEVEREALVPLAQLVGGQARRGEIRAGLDHKLTGVWNRNLRADIGSRADLDALSSLLSDIGRGSVIFDDPIPFAILDACRFGHKPCLTAHLAIADATGGVRPCSRGDVVGKASDTCAEYQGRMKRLHDQLVARRGCAACSARGSCSQCAFPFLLEEAEYCDFIRRHEAALKRAHKMTNIIALRWPAAIGVGELRVKLAPGSPLIAARELPPKSGKGGKDREIDLIAANFEGWGAMLVMAGGHAAVEIEHWSRLDRWDFPAADADIVELAVEGAPRAAIHAQAAERNKSGAGVDQVISALFTWI